MLNLKAINSNAARRPAFSPSTDRLSISPNLNLHLHPNPAHSSNVHSQPAVVALVATRFRAEWLSRLLASLQQQTLRPLAAVVCDNGPDAGTLEAAKKSPLRCELVSPGKNLGFGGGLAAAGQRALERFPDLTHLLVVDDDTIFRPNDLKGLLAAAARHAAGAVAPLLIDVSGKLLEAPEPVSWNLARSLRKVGRNLDATRTLAPNGYPMAWCIGPCMLVDKATWLRAGPPRSDMLAYGDDVEFSLRLSAASPAWAESSVTVVHDPPKPSAAPLQGGADAMEGDPLDLRQEPSPERVAHYQKFGILLQNLAFTCAVSPRPRHLPLYLPGNARRFLQTFGWNAKNLWEVVRRYFLGLWGVPAGR
ncbi:MAG: glycosyltransferase [Verrucomicrobia bacterium]|nr:glycosyltransferase [Verrucomicrobiota bacterium]